MNTHEEMPQWAQELSNSLDELISQMNNSSTSKEEEQKVEKVAKDDFSDIDRFIKSAKEIEGIE